MVGGVWTRRTRCTMTIFLNMFFEPKRAKLFNEHISHHHHHHPLPPHMGFLTALCHFPALHPLSHLIVKPIPPHMWLHAALEEHCPLSHNTLPSTPPTFPAMSNYQFWWPPMHLSLTSSSHLTHPP